MLQVLDIQRMSSEDGPGLRTTAFFKGCSLACAWCHNPESIDGATTVIWHSTLCMGCGSCLEACPERALQLEEQGIVISRSACTAIECLACVRACPTAAMETKGRPFTPEELVEELIKDRAYWGDEGGVTLSGGEALLQRECVTVLKKLKERGVQTALDTCGQVSPAHLEAALPFTDIVLYDVKLGEAEEHRRWTGATNELILSNLKMVLSWAKGGGTLWLRTPLIPGATDSSENIKALAGLLKELVQDPEVVERWELCSFNNLCQAKYDSLQQEWHFEGVPLVEAQHAEFLRVLAEESGIGTIRVTGATS